MFFYITVNRKAYSCQTRWLPGRSSRNDSFRGLNLELKTETTSETKQSHSLTKCLGKSACECFKSDKPGSVRTVVFQLGRGGGKNCLWVVGGGGRRGYAEEDGPGRVLVQCSHP